ncbi:Hypothetical protein RADP37_04798 (plasmid) [Roseomonas mucosa]|uniref:Thiol:disulfide interchange protein DsbG n=1 Tax=Roseomonas mucosa TaxID=207340 RepID=A0A4Y1MRP1_9PROT|nr:Hypothetical protein RADP37_04798 [Roseomonas mucosa]
MRRILLTTCALVGLPAISMAQTLCPASAGPDAPPTLALPAPVAAAPQAWPTASSPAAQRTAAPAAAPSAAPATVATPGGDLSVPVLQRVSQAGATLQDLGLSHGLRLVVARSGAEFMLLSVLPSGRAMVAGFPVDLTLARLREIGGAGVTDLGEREGLRSVVLRSGDAFQVFYATPDGERVIPGVMWDTAGKNLTRDHVAGIEGAIPTVTIGDVAPGAAQPAGGPAQGAGGGAVAPAASPVAVAQRAHAGTTGPEGAPHVWMFVDPQCGYSVQALQRLQPLVAAGRLHLSVIPVAILDHHNAGRSTADALAMLSRSEEAMIAAWSRGDLRAPPAPEAAARLRENGAAAASIGLRGTPTLVWRRADGTEGRTDGLPNNLEALVATATGG